MHQEKWEQIKGQLLDTFDEVEFVKEKLPEPQIGEVETAYFNGPLGKMKLEYITRPVVLEKRTHGSRRIGSKVDIEYIYSDTEKIQQLKVFRQVGDDWAEIETKDSFAI